MRRRSGGCAIRAFGRCSESGYEIAVGFESTLDDCALSMLSEKAIKTNFNFIIFCCILSISDFCLHLVFLLSFFLWFSVPKLHSFAPTF